MAYFDTKYTFRLGELYCGPGGLAYGALHAHSRNGLLDVQHVWANDVDPDTCATYRNNICPENPDSVICKDVRSLNIQKLAPINAFAYGFPCNSFSSIGEHQGMENEKFGRLYWYGIEVLRTFKPLWFIAENVSGIRTAGTNDFKQILTDMEESGYKLTVHLYKAEEYGVPQIRHRYIIVGIRGDLPVEFHVPSPEPYKNIDVTAGHALADIPEWASNNDVKKLTQRVIGKLEHTLPGQNIWQAMKIRIFRMNTASRSITAFLRFTGSCVLISRVILSQRMVEGELGDTIGMALGNSQIAREHVFRLSLTLIRLRGNIPLCAARSAWQYLANYRGL